MTIKTSGAFSPWRIPLFPQFSDDRGPVLLSLSHGVMLPSGLRKWPRNNNTNGHPHTSPPLCGRNKRAPGFLYKRPLTGCHPTPPTSQIRTESHSRFITSSTLMTTATEALPPLTLFANRRFGTEASRNVESITTPRGVCSTSGTVKSAMGWRYGPLFSSMLAHFCLPYSDVDNQQLGV